MGRFVKWNLRRGREIPEDAVRMDRMTRWGNPFKDGTREENIAKHMAYLREEWKRDAVTREMIRGMARKIKNGEDVHVSCWCYPLPCHLDNWEKAVMALVEKGLV